MRHIPNFITSLNLASGFFAIICAVNGNLVSASWLILAAMVFDFFDGFSARMLKAYSGIGKELDSLADLVSFGVAPAIIIYNLLKISLGIEGSLFVTPVDPISLLICFSPVLMVVFAALRLAIFNTDESQATSFKGLPTPANALAIISLVLASDFTGINLINKIIKSPAALITLIIMLSLLMVSRLPMLSLKTTHLRFAGNEGRYIMIILIIAAILILGPATVSLIIPVYIIISITSAVFFKQNVNAGK